MLYIDLNRSIFEEKVFSLENMSVENALYIKHHFYPDSSRIFSSLQRIVFCHIFFNFLNIKTQTNFDLTLLSEKEGLLNRDS